MLVRNSHFVYIDNMPVVTISSTMLHRLLTYVHTLVTQCLIYKFENIA